MVQQRARNRRAGHSLIEVTIGIVVLAPVVLFLLDFSFVLWGVQTNDQLCRNAARAAAFGNPTEATERAQAVLSGTNQSSNLVSNSTLIGPVQVNVTHEPPTEFDPLSRTESSPGGPVSGDVTVETEVRITPFLLQKFVGRQRNLTFRAQESYPITYIMPVSHPPQRPANPDGD
jgi:Flp pilus assembly protein TadG